MSENDESDLDKDEAISPEVEVDKNEDNQAVEEEEKTQDADGGDNIGTNTGIVYVMLSVVMCILIVCYIIHVVR